MSIKEIKGKYKAQVKEAIADLKSNDKDRRKKQIPNLLTASRLFAPVFIIPAAAFGNLPLAGALTCMFAATDGADGFLARKWNATSELGRDLDAITDKVFAGTLLITLSFTQPALLATLGMEGVIGGINAYSKTKGLEPRTELVGKAKTASLLALIVTAFASSFVKLPNGLFPDLLALTTALQAVTAGAYISQYKKQKAKADRIKAIEDIDKELEVEHKAKEDVKRKEKVLVKKKSSSHATKDDFKALRKIVEENSREVIDEKVEDVSLDNKVIKKSRINK